MLRSCSSSSTLRRGRRARCARLSPHPTLPSLDFAGLFFLSLPHPAPHRSTVSSHIRSTPPTPIPAACDSSAPSGAGSTSSTRRSSAIEDGISAHVKTLRAPFTGGDGARTAGFDAGLANSVRTVGALGTPTAGRARATESRGVGHAAAFFAAKALTLIALAARRAVLQAGDADVILAAEAIEAPE